MLDALADEVVLEALIEPAELVREHLRRRVEAVSPEYPLTTPLVPAELVREHLRPPARETSTRPSTLAESR